MTGPKKSPDYLRQDRHDRLIRELEHDPYHSKRKITEPSVCPECGAFYHHGRWAWGEAPAGAYEHLCPACHRIHDHVPAAYLNLRGDFLADHKEEILHLIQHYEQRERKEHPLKRIMAIEEQPEGLEITFTDAHLARGIGEAIHHAYQGDIDYQYIKEDIMLRVSWQR